VGEGEEDEGDERKKERKEKKRKEKKESSYPRQILHLGDDFIHRVLNEGKRIEQVLFAVSLVGRLEKLGNPADQTSCLRFQFGGEDRLGVGAQSLYDIAVFYPNQ